MDRSQPTDPTQLPLQRDLSLYVHVPFCTVKCDYCDFFSLAGVTPVRMEATTEAIIEDLVRLLPAALAPGATVPTVYIGGGTPSVLPKKSLRKLVDAVAASLRTPPQEWTVELNPETLSAETLDILYEAGVNRLSLGVQSLTETGLRALGRAASGERTLRSLELISGEWRGRWNADLIVGFQGDTPERVAADLELLTRMGARHLSVYALTVEPGTPLAARVESGAVTLPGEEELLELLTVAEGELRKRGIARYEVSNYALPGAESLHNLRYWRMAPYLGVGPAAASTLYKLGSPLRGVRLEGTRSVTRYLAEPASRYRGEDLSGKDLLLEHLLMGLRTKEGVPLERLEERFGIPREAVREAIGSAAAFQQAGESLLEITPSTPEALRVPESWWHLLDRAVFRATERILPLLE